jgi:glycosyltransferase involved in cell wall biosynthesis
MPVSLVSVVIAVHNGERYLAQAIASALSQADVTVDVVVVDDGSTDASAAVAREFLPRIRLVERRWAGAAAARNAGISLARGTYLTMLDADDLLPPGSLASRVVAEQAASPPVELVWGRVQSFVTSEVPAAEAARIACVRTPVPGRLAGALLLRRSTFDAVGPLPTHLRVGEFIAWAALAQERGLTELDIPDVVLHRRLHRTNMGRLERGARVDYARLLKEMLDRRRAAGTAST